MENAFDVQQFYDDRRNRKMTDAMIVNELEASGWSIEVAKAAVAKAQAAYQPPVDTTFVKTSDTIEYILPKLNGKAFWKKYGWKILGITVLGSAYMYAEADGKISVVFGIGFVVILIGLMVMQLVAKNAKLPMHVTLTHDGMTLQDSKRTQQKPFAKYVAVSLPEVQSTPFQRMLGGGQVPLTPANLSSIGFYVKASPLEVNPSVSFSLEVPPEHYAEVKAFLLARLPSTPPKGKMTGSLIRAIGVIISLAALVLAAAVILLNRNL
jgi:hypothetical protein